MELNAIVRTYISLIRPLAQTELDWFRHQPNLASAIEQAALAINSEGKRYSHQHRIRKSNLTQAKVALLDSTEVIERCDDFGELLELVEARVQSIKGIGELYVYDTSLRIGAKLNLLPGKIYLHAGTRDGAAALGFDKKVRYLEISALPVELQQLQPHEIEDVLCIFKKDMRDVKIVETSNILKRSWCG